VNVEHRHRRIDGGDAFPDTLQHFACVLADPRVQNHLAPAGIRLQKRHVDDRLDLAPRIAVPGILDHADDRKWLPRGSDGHRRRVEQSPTTTRVARLPDRILTGENLTDE
jgi:hypothetical protein